MRFTFSFAVGLFLAGAGVCLQPAFAQGVMDELKAWEAATPTREAEQEAARRRARDAWTPCKGEEALCATQLIERGWVVVSSGFEPLGVDIGFEFKLLGRDGQHKICTTYISYDGTGQERPCHGMTKNINSVKN